MYEVISKGERVAIVEMPRYVKVKSATGAFIQCSEAEAEGVAVTGKVYRLGGKLKALGLTEAEVHKVDGGEVVFEHDADLVVVHGSLLDIETALCELDLA